MPDSLTDILWEEELSLEIQNLVALYWINRNVIDLLQEWYQYLNPIKRRNFGVSEEGNIYVKTRGIQNPRIIDKVNSNETSGLENNILRELSILLGSKNDWFIASDIQIERFLELLLRISVDENCRKELKKVFQKYWQFFEQRHTLKDLEGNRSLEWATSKLLRLEYEEWLKLSEDDKRTINVFNWWANKATHSAFPNYYFCWVVTIGILKMINLEK